MDSFRVPADKPQLHDSFERVLVLDLPLMCIYRPLLASKETEAFFPTIIVVQSSGGIRTIHVGEQATKLQSRHMGSRIFRLDAWQALRCCLDLHRSGHL